MTTKKKRSRKTKKKLAAMPETYVSDREAAEFWDSHSVADYWNELESVDLSLKPAPRDVVTLRLDRRATNAIRALARRKGTNYSTLVRSWIAERLQRELKNSKRRSDTKKVA